LQPDRFTIKSQEAIQAAQTLADDRRNPQVTPEAVELVLRRLRYVGEYLAQGAALRAHLEAVARRRTEALGALVDRVLNTTAGAAAQPALNVV